MKKYLLISISVILTVLSAVVLYSRIFPRNSIPNYENIQYTEDAENLESDEEIVESPVNHEQDEISAVCEQIKKIDFSIKSSTMNLSKEDDDMYREAYLDILKSKIPTTDDYYKKKVYFTDLYNTGAEFKELIESDRFSFYYDDFDSDGLPELGVRCSAYSFLLLKYEPEKNEFSIIYIDESMYVKMLGMGQIWRHDGLHVGIIRDSYIVCNDEGKWENILDAEKYNNNKGIYYCVTVKGRERIKISEEKWEEVMRPFFEATKNVMPSRSLEEVFGDRIY